MVDIGDKVLVIPGFGGEHIAIPLVPVDVGDRVFLYTLKDGMQIPVPDLSFALGDQVFVTPDFDFAGFDFNVKFGFDSLTLKPSLLDAGIKWAAYVAGPAIQVYMTPIIDSVLPGTGNIIIAADHIFARDDPGIKEHHKNTGWLVKYRYPNAGRCQPGGMKIISGKLYIGYSDSIGDTHVAGFDLTTSDITPLWKTSLNAPVGGAPAQYRYDIFVLTQSATIYRLDGTTGDVVLSYAPYGAHDNGDTPAAPLVEQSYVYWGDTLYGTYGVIFRVYYTGSGGGYKSLYGPSHYGTPVYNSVSGEIIFCTHDSNMDGRRGFWVYGIRRSDFSLRWAYRIGITAGHTCRTPPVIDAAGNIYVVNVAGSVNKFDKYGNFEGSWWAPIGNSLYSGAGHCPTYNAIAVQCANGYLYLIDKTTMTTIGSVLINTGYPTNSLVTSTPIEGPDGTIYVGSNDGKLYAIVAV